MNYVGASDSGAALALADIPSSGWSTQAWQALRQEVQRQPATPEETPALTFNSALKSGIVSTNGSIVTALISCTASMNSSTGLLPGVHVMEVVVSEQSSGEVRASIPLAVVVAVPRLRVFPQSLQELLRPVSTGSGSAASVGVSVSNSGNAPLEWSALLDQLPCWATLRRAPGTFDCATPELGDHCAVGMLQPSSTIFLQLDLAAGLLSTGQHNSLLRIAGGESIVTVPISIVVTSVAVCPSDVELLGLRAPSNGDPLLAAVRHHSLVSLQNLGEAPLVLEMVTAIAADEQAVQARLRALSDPCNSANASSSHIAVLEALEREHGVPDWLSGVIGAGPHDTATQQLHATPGTWGIQGASPRIPIGSSGFLSIFMTLNRSNALGRHVGMHAAVVAVVMRDQLRNTTEVRTVGVRTRVDTGPTSPFFSRTFTLRRAVDASERAVGSLGLADASERAGAVVSITMLKDSFGHSRPPGKDRLQAFSLWTGANPSLRVPFCWSDVSSDMRSAGDIVTLREVLMHEAQQLLLDESSSLSGVELAELQQHVAGGGSLWAMYVHAASSAPLSLALRAESLQSVSGLPSGEYARLEMTGIVNCAGSEVPASAGGSLELGDVRLYAVPLSEMGSARALSAASAALLHVTTTPASCSAPGTVLDPQSGLTCACQPGFSVADSLRGTVVTSRSLQCVPCPSGTQRRGASVRFASEPGSCSPCPSGHFSFPGWHTCAPCPSNMQCDGGLVEVAAGHSFVEDAIEAQLLRAFAPKYSGTGPGSGMPQSGVFEDAAALAQPSVSAAVACPNPFACLGAAEGVKNSSDFAIHRAECAVGHDASSPLCSACLDGFEHSPTAAGSAGDCRQCPPTSASATKVALLTMISAAVYVLVLVSWFHPSLGPGSLPPALLVYPAKDRPCCGAEKHQATRPVLPAARETVQPGVNPMLASRPKTPSMDEQLPTGTVLAVHAIPADALWTVAAPNLPIAQRERAAPLFRSVKRTLKWDLPKWVLSWDSMNRTVPATAFHSLYKTMLATGRRSLPVPGGSTLKPTVDVSLRAFSGLALLLFLQLSARLADTRLGADTQGEATSAIPHMSSLFPVSSLEASCLISTFAGGYSRFGVGAGLIIGSVPVALLLAACAAAVLSCFKCFRWKAALVTGSRTASMQQGKGARRLSLTTITDAWSVALASPAPAPFVSLFLAAWLLVLPNMVPAGISVMGSAVFATAPNGLGGESLLSDFSVQAGTPDHTKFVTVAVILGVFAFLGPLALACFWHTACMRQLRRTAKSSISLVGNAASMHLPLSGSFGTFRGCMDTCFLPHMWRVGGLLFGWFRPRVWWWHLALFVLSCGLALLPSVLQNPWSRLYAANVATLALWLAFEWRKPYAAHRLIGAPRSVYPTAPRLVLPPHLLYTDRDRDTRLPALAPRSVFRGAHAAGQRAGRALLAIGARLRTRLMRVLFFAVFAQASLAHMAHVWQASMFASTSETTDTADAMGSPSARLREALEDSRASATLPTAMRTVAWLQWAALWVGIAACCLIALPNSLRGAGLAGLSLLRSGIFAVIDAALAPCDKLRAKQQAAKVAAAAGASSYRKLVARMAAVEKPATSRSKPQRCAVPSEPEKDDTFQYTNPMRTPRKQLKESSKEKEETTAPQQDSKAAPRKPSIVQGLNPMLTSTASLRSTARLSLSGRPRQGLRHQPLSLRPQSLRQGSMARSASEASAGAVHATIAAETGQQATVVVSQLTQPQRSRRTRPGRGVLDRSDSTVGHDNPIHAGRGQLTSKAAVSELLRASRANARKELAAAVAQPRSRRRLVQPSSRQASSRKGQLL